MELLPQLAHNPPQSPEPPEEQGFRARLNRSVKLDGHILTNVQHAVNDFRSVIPFLKGNKNIGRNIE